MSILDSIGNFFKEIIGGVKEVIKSFSDVALRTMNEIETRFNDFVKEVKEDLPKALETVKKVITEVAKKVIEIGNVVAEGVGKILEIPALGVMELVKVVYEVGKVVVDQIKEHPKECISIMASFIATGVLFASGNYLQAFSCLSSGILKYLKFIEELPDEQKDVYKENLPANFNQLYEKHQLKEKNYNEIDQYVKEQSYKCLPDLSDTDRLQGKS